LIAIKIDENNYTKVNQKFNELITIKNKQEASLADSQSEGKACIISNLHKKLRRSCTRRRRRITLFYLAMDYIIET
jgi:hypothetical protein